MKFTFGKYKGQEIAEIGASNPAYLTWLLDNMKTIPKAEYFEIKKCLKQGSVGIEINDNDLFCSPTSEDNTSSLSQYVGKYLKSNNAYWKITSTQRDCLGNSAFEKLCGVCCIDASKVADVDLIIRIGYIMRGDITNYHPCTKAEYQKNLKQLLAAIDK